MCLHSWGGHVAISPPRRLRAGTHLPARVFWSTGGLLHNGCNRCLVQAIDELGIEPTLGSGGTFDSEPELEPKLFA
jgi:hypothetical protein